MIAWKCLRCGCIHGWGDHPKVTKVERHVRLSGEDVWWCPQCNRQHRTWDGTLMGQSQKLWEQIPNIDSYDDSPKYEMCVDGMIRRII